MIMNEIERVKMLKFRLSTFFYSAEYVNREIFFDGENVKKARLYDSSLNPKGFLICDFIK
jgi:hypothetical protein